MGTWSYEPEKIREVLKTPIKADDATKILYSILGDDRLFDDIADVVDYDPEIDVRALVICRMEEMRDENK